MKPATDYYRDLERDLKDPKEAAAYLNASLDAGDKEAFLLALKNVLDAYGGISGVSRRAGINRVSIYKMLASNGNPGFGNILRLLQSVGIRFQAMPISNSASRKKAA